MAKSLNVQSQNIRTLDDILSFARYWRDKELPEAVLELLENKGISTKKLIVIHCLQGSIYQEPNGMCWTIFTEEHDFYDLEVVFDAEFKHIVEVSEWKQTTLQYNFSKSNKGIGKGFGYLAIEAQAILNRDNNETEL